MAENIICKICFKSISPAYMTRHYSYHEKIGIYCSFCPEGFNCKESLFEHVETHFHEKIFHCLYCDKGFHFKENEVAHFINEILSPQSSFLPCNGCGKQYKTMVRLRRHFCLVKQCCSLCKKQFSTKSTLVRHEKRCRGTQCIACGEYFKSSEEVNEQYCSTACSDIKVSDVDVDKVTTCVICNIIVKGVYAFIIHKAYHHGFVPELCPLFLTDNENVQIFVGCHVQKHPYQWRLTFDKSLDD